MRAYLTNKGIPCWDAVEMSACHHMTRGKTELLQVGFENEAINAII
jgi:hypothetical protein